MVGEIGARRGRANDLAHAGRAIGRTLWLPITTRCGPPAARRRSCSCTSRTRRALLVYAAAGYRADGSDRISKEKLDEDDIRKLMSRMDELQAERQAGSEEGE